jgi:hypothetical protein
MSLYREAGSRRGRTVAVLAGALVVGLLIGFGLAWALKPAPTLADRIEDVQEDVRPALDALELVPIHYDSENEVTRQAASDQLAAAREELDAVRDDLEALDPSGAVAVATSLALLQRLLEQGAASQQVDQAVQQVEREVRETARLD